MGALEIILVVVIVLAVIAASAYRHKWRKEKAWHNAEVALHLKYLKLWSESKDELASVKAELDLYKNHEAETRVMGQKVRITTEGTTEQGGKAVINVKGLDSEEGERYDCVFTHNGELYRCFLYVQPYADMLMSRNVEQTIPSLDDYEAYVIKL